MKFQLAIFINNEYNYLILLSKDKNKIRNCIIKNIIYNKKLIYNINAYV